MKGGQKTKQRLLPWPRRERSTLSHATTLTPLALWPVLPHLLCLSSSWRIRHTGSKPSQRSTRVWARCCAMEPLLPKFYSACAGCRRYWDRRLAVQSETLAALTCVPSWPRPYRWATNVTIATKQQPHSSCAKIGRAHV